VDVERAKAESPFGTTIAHGNLTLSLIDGFRLGLIRSTGFKLGVNYGWNKVRFPAPVPAGSRVRASAEVISVEEVAGGWQEVVTRFTLEVEGSDKPCCAADSVGQEPPRMRTARRCRAPVPSALLRLSRQLTVGGPSAPPSRWPGTSHWYV
jgi:acyl dehydratase